MIHGNVELHNVAECREMDDGGGCFQRVPEKVRLGLNDHAQERMLDVVGSEIRFVLEDGKATVDLHPTDYGHTIIAENLARELGRLMQDA